MASLAIVEKKPPPFSGGGCTGGVLFHLLDWHRRLARKRRLFSPRRLLPASLRSSSTRHRLPCPPPASPTPQQQPTAPPHPADGPAPGVVARLMGLESWPATATATATAAPPRPQKQRKVEASRADDSAAVVLVLPTTTTRSRRPPAPASPPTARSHHGADLPARSPRRTRLVHAAAAKLLDPGARAGARLALAYACSSPQHRRKDGHAGALLQGSPGMADDDFLSRSDSLPLERSARVQVLQPPPGLPAEADCDTAAVSRRHDHCSSNNANAAISTSTAVLPTMDFGDGNRSKRTSDVDSKHKESRVRNEVMRTCARVRSSGAAVQTGEERLLRKRATATRPEVSGIAESGGLADSTRLVGRARELVSATRKDAHGGSGPRREIVASITGQGSTIRRDLNSQNGLASTGRISNNGSARKRGSGRKVGHDRAMSNRDDRNAVAFTSKSSTKPVARASSRSNLSKSGSPSRLAPDTTRTRVPAPEKRHMEASPSVLSTSEKDEFSRLLKAKINELGMLGSIECTPDDSPSGKLTAPVLQELISVLTNDMSTPISQCSNYSGVSAPLSCNGSPTRLATDTTRTRVPAPERRYIEASPSVLSTSEKGEFSRLLKAKINELGMSGRIECRPDDPPSGKLPVPVLQKLISSLANDMSTPISECSNYSGAPAPLSCNGNVDCINREHCISSNAQSPDFQKCYQVEQNVDSSATSLNNEPNQPSPTSVLEAFFSNDTSSLGSPVEKNEGKGLIVSIENKMEDLFSFESDIVDLAMLVDTRKTVAEETPHSNDKLPCLQNFLSHDFNILESRLCSIREAISNAELLLGSSLLHSTKSGLPLHPFIVKMLENTMDMFRGEEYSDFTEDKKYQHTNFLFDCIIESLDSKFCNFGKCGYKAWLKLPLSLSRDLLKRLVLEDISSWRESSGTALRQVSDKEVDQVTDRWDAIQIEAFDISVAIEKDILEALVVELAVDLWWY